MVYGRVSSACFSLKPSLRLRSDDPAADFDSAFFAGAASPSRAVTPRSSTQRPRCATMRSEEDTSELQSLMRTSYAVFGLKKKKYNTMLDTYTTNKYQINHV